MAQQMRKQIVVTRRSRNAEYRIEHALKCGKVMAKAGNWFEVISFRSELADPQHPEYGNMWFATGRGRYGEPRELQVSSFRWYESLAEQLTREQYDAGILSPQVMALLRADWGWE